jgi:hypothetical protein
MFNNPEKKILSGKMRSLAPVVRNRGRFFNHKWEVHGYWTHMLWGEGIFTNPEQILSGKMTSSANFVKNRGKFFIHKCKVSWPQSRVESHWKSTGITT